MDKYVIELPRENGTMRKITDDQLWVKWEDLDTFIYQNARMIKQLKEIRKMAFKETEYHIIANDILHFLKNMGYGVSDEKE